MPSELELDIERPGALVLPGGATTNHEASFTALIGRYLGVVMAIAFLILLLYLVWGAIEWITSAGDSGKLTSARNRMLHAVVGILILSSVLALFLFVQYIVGVEVLKFNFAG